MPRIDQVKQNLVEYYEGKLPESKSIEISDMRYIEQGMDNEMYSFHLEYVEKTKKHGEDLILRLSRNREGKLREFQALEKLSSTSIPVPKMHDFGQHESDFSFIIMEKIEGQDMWGGAMDGSETEEAGIWEQSARLLADIHMLDWEKAGFAFLGPPEDKYSYANQWISRLKDWSDHGGKHELRPVLDWLRQNKPPSYHYVLLHGDYHPGNILAHKGKITAIVDWDGVHIGDPAFDVCEMPLVIKMVDFSGEQLGSVTDKFLEDYKEATGSELRNLDFYLVVKSAFFLLAFSSNSDIDRGLRSAVLEACAKLIQEGTGIKIPLSS